MTDDNRLSQTDIAPQTLAARVYEPREPSEQARLDAIIRVRKEAAERRAVVDALTPQIRLARPKPEIARRIPLAKDAWLGMNETERAAHRDATKLRRTDPEMQAARAKLGEQRYALQQEKRSHRPFLRWAKLALAFMRGRTYASQETRSGSFNKNESKPKVDAFSILARTFIQDERVVGASEMGRKQLAAIRSWIKGEEHASYVSLKRQEQLFVTNPTPSAF